ncbi:MAG: molybdopterin-dependent oxidoreductase [Candidatus Bathyarchaeota archaeon]|nr:molybdopterin-dependent oxidoreductase [Candidatus Bathyarchaeota archaeon]
MKSNTKLVIAFFAVLILALVPLYYYAHPINASEGTLQIKGNVGSPQNLTLAEIDALPPVTVQATLVSSGSPQENGVFNYTGVLLKDLLGLVEVSSNATSVYVQASDAYGSTLLLKDAQNNSTLLAYAKDGAPLTDLKGGGEGPLRLVIGGDQYAQRWVKGVVSITVT